MILKKKKDQASSDKQSDDITMNDIDALDEVSIEESGDYQKESKTIEEFLEMKKRQNEVLRKLIENMDKAENR